MSRCEQTWVDGRKYFDREEEKSVRVKNHEMKTALIQKVLLSGDKTRKPSDRKIDPARLWLRYDESCGHHRHNFNDDFDY